MTREEFQYWQSRIEDSRFQWTEDEIFRLNGKGYFYYLGGEDGVYIKIHRDGLIEAGTYAAAFPHIGDACFTIVIQKQCRDYNEDFDMALRTGGRQFLIDMFSASVVKATVETGRMTMNRTKSRSECSGGKNRSRSRNRSDGEPEL